MTRLGLWGAAAACLVAGALTAPPMTFVPVNEAVTWVEQATDPAHRVIESAPPSVAPTADRIVDEIAALTDTSASELVPDAADPPASRTATTRRTQEARPDPAETSVPSPAGTPPPTAPGTSETPADPGSNPRRPDPKPEPDCPPAGDKRAEKAVELAQRCKAQS